LRATFAITNRQLATAQSRALSAHKAVFECVRMRDADGARLATIELLEIAARDLDSKRAGAAVGAPGFGEEPKDSG
jgi:DNA-binding FadR family transcriptional regulator